MNVTDISTNYVTSMLDNSIASAAVARAKKAAAEVESTDKEDDVELMNACKNFEEYFIEQILKEGFKTINKDTSSMSASSQSLLSYYEDGLAREIASSATDHGGYGLAQLMYEQMSRETFTMAEVREREAEKAAAEAEEKASSEKTASESTTDEKTEET